MSMFDYIEAKRKEKPTLNKKRIFETAEAQTENDKSIFETVEIPTENDKTGFRA